jgi:hypothetical protein
VRDGGLGNEEHGFLLSESLIFDVLANLLVSAAAPVLCEASALSGLQVCRLKLIGKDKVWYVHSAV